MGECRLEERELHGPVIGEKEQSLAVGIQPARGVYTGRLDVVGKRGTGRNGAVCELSQDTEGFVEENVSHKKRSGGTSAPPLSL